MRRQLFAFVFIFSTIFTSFALGNGTLPDWVLPELNRYPIDTYLFDIGRSNKKNEEEAYKEAISEASKNLSKRILKQVVGVIGWNSGNVNYQMVVEHYSAVLEDYCSWHHAFPALQLEGLKHENLSVVNARQGHETYAVVYIERDKLKKIYADHKLRLLEEIERQLAKAKEAEADLKINKAVEIYYRTYPLYETVKEAEIIQIGAEHRINYIDAFKDLADEATRRNGNSLPHRTVIKRVEELNRNNIVETNDIFNAVNAQLIMQANPPHNSVSIYPLMYEDSEIISPFAKMFTMALRQALPNWVFVDPMLEFDQPIIDVQNINNDNPSFRLSSSCWENGDELNIRVTLRNMNNGKFHGSSVVRFMKNDIRDPQDYQPRGYEEAQKERQAFNPRYYVSEDYVSEHSRGDAPKEHVFSPTGGLKIDFWTDKGRGPLSFAEGERVRIFVRVDQPVYLRLLNIHAEQKRALLKDNFYIGSDQVNKSVVIGMYECSSPFGRELFVVAARTEKFPAVETVEEDGYRFLKEKDAEKAVVSFRAFKPIDEQQIIGPKPITDKRPSFQQNEAQLTITTTKKK